MLPEADLLQHWGAAELAALGNKRLIVRAKENLQELHKEWLMIASSVIKANPAFESNTKVYNEAEFSKAMTQVGTRIFGWNLSCDVMIPLGDCMNHSSRARTQYGVVDRTKKKEYIRTSSTATTIARGGSKIDHSLLIKSSEHPVAPAEDRYVCVRGVRVSKTQVEALRTIEDGKTDMWELDLYSSSDEAEEDETDREEEEAGPNLEEDFKPMGEEAGGKQEEGEGEEEEEEEDSFDSEDDEMVEELYDKYLARIKDPFERMMLAKVSSIEKAEIIKQQRKALLPRKSQTSKSESGWWKYDSPDLFFCFATAGKGYFPQSPTSVDSARARR